MELSIGRFHDGNNLPQKATPPQEGNVLRRGMGEVRGRDGNTYTVGYTHG